LLCSSYDQHGYALQRLFSTFPNGWPGGGLLLLRLSLASVLCYVDAPGLFNRSEPIVIAQQLTAAAGALLLLIGLWTPLVGTVVAINQMWIAAASPYSPGREETEFHVFVAMLAVSVAMLGPGAWSLDARLFGRRRLDINRTRGKRSSL
jgi:putative oxidoreductase